MNKTTIIVLIIIIVLLLTISGTALYFSTQSKNKKSESNDNEEEENKENEEGNETDDYNECPLFVPITGKKLINKISFPPLPKKVFDKIDKQECLNKCLNLGPECQWVNYNPDNKICTINHLIHNDSEHLVEGDKKTNLMDSDLYILIKNNEEACPEYSKYSNYEWYGNHIENAGKKVKDNDECYKLCKSYDCDFYIHDKGKGYCSPMKFYNKTDKNDNSIDMLPVSSY